MGRQVFFLLALLLGLVFSLMMVSGGAVVQADSPVTADEVTTVSGTIIHILETPADVAGNPSLASITNDGMSCAVSFGNNLGGTDNFGMVVYSEVVGDTRVIGRMVIQWGKARSITTENGEIMESAIYDYVVLAMDNSALGEEDTWSMTLWGQEQMFDGVTFSGPVIVGDLSVQP
jgi:hypothetical protein